MWRNIRFLARRETRRYPLPAALTAVFYMVIGLMLGGSIMSVESSTYETAKVIQRADNDWILLAIASVLGFVYTKDYLHYYRSDVFSRKLAFYRKLPIRNEEIAYSRYLVMLGTLAVMAVFFYTPLYLVLRTEDIVSPGTFLLAVLMWTGISIAAGSLYVYLELGFSGKRYMMGSFIIVFFYLAAVIVMTVLDRHLVDGSFRLAERYGAMPSILALLLAFLIAAGLYRLTLRRLAVRDLL